jgi:hypothetical protein
MTKLDQEFRDAASAASDVGGYAQGYPLKDGTQCSFLDLDQRVPGVVVCLRPSRIAPVKVKRFQVQSITHRRLCAMGEHVGDGPKLCVRLCWIAERPRAQQTQPPEADQQTFQFGFVLHPRTLVRRQISHP